MTAPKKKTAKKGQTAPKKKAAPRPKVSTEQVEKAQKSVAEAPKEKAPDFLSKDHRTFRVGTMPYREVIEHFNKLRGTRYNRHRVPPYVFKTIFIRLRNYYGVDV